MEYWKKIANRTLIESYQHKFNVFQIEENLIKSFQDNKRLWKAIEYLCENFYLLIDEAKNKYKTEKTQSLSLLYDY